MRIGTGSVIAAAALALLAGNLGRLPFIEIGGRPGAITLLDFVLLPLWLLLAIKLPGGQRRWRFDGLSLGLIAFVAVAALSTLAAGPKWGLSAGAWAGAAAFLLRWVLYAGFFVLIVSDPDAPQAGADAWRRVDRVVLAMALFGILQAALLPGFGTLVYSITGIPSDPQGHRLVSTLLDPQPMGGLLAIALLMRLAQAAEGLPQPRWPIALLAVALALTVSRSAILGAFAGVAVIVAVRGITPALRRVAALGALLALPLLPPLLYFAAAFNKLSVDGSALQRLIPWLRGLVLIRDNPVLGVGFNAAGAAQAAYGWSAVGGSDASMDGGLLFVAVMTGLLGLSAFVLMLGALAVIARRVWRAPTQRPEARAAAVGGVAATVAVLVQSLFTNSLLIPFIALPLWILWAWVVALRPLALRRRARAASPPPPLFAHAFSPARASLGKLGAVALLSLGLAGCDPCTGLAECGGGAGRSISGTILSRETDQPRAGVIVEAEGRATSTNTAGRWQIDLPPGDSTLPVRVRADGGEYEVPAVRARARRVRGDADDVGVWYDRPRFGYIMGLIYRDELLRNAQVRFTADAAFGGVVLNANTGAGGYLRFSGDAPAAGPITGTLRVVHPTVGTWTFPGVPIEGDYASFVEPIRKWFVMDKRFPYGGNVVNRGTFEASPGTTVTFTRTAGLTLEQNPVTVTTDANGFFFFELQPRGRGEIRGTLRFTPPVGAPYTYPDVRLTTYDSTTARHIGLYAHGERWDWVFEIRRSSDSSLVTWTNFEFERTGGLAIEPSNRITGLSNGSGRLLVRANVRDTGTVTGVLRLRPSGQPAVTVGTFNLRTFAADSQNFAGTQYVTLP